MVICISIPIIILVTMRILMYIIFKHTTFGFKEVRIMGTNLTAVKFSGIDIKSINMKIFILSGILATIAGIIVLSRLIQLLTSMAEKHIL